MSTEDELRARIVQIEAQVAELQQRTIGDIRLGPQPETQEEIDRRTARLTDIISKAGVHEHEQDAEGRQICTTSGEAPSKARAEQIESTGQHKSYIVLCAEERAKGFVRPFRDEYKHLTCGSVTTMGRALSETYARDPTFYDATFCCHCNRHLPVAEFVWTVDGERVGS